MTKEEDKVREIRNAVDDELIESLKKLWMEQRKIEAINIILARDIFLELDKAIEKCICANPKVWNESQFRKYYQEIKKKWTKQ